MPRAGNHPVHQRDYYARTAAHYDAMHVRDRDEHGIALAIFAGLARLYGATSVLDVGAGTGRALLRLSRDLPGVSLTGIEPVAELRAVGHANGIEPNRLIEGDATALPFADDSFDFVIETGMLHHLERPAVAVAEMVRVARLGVMISDSNNFGQGSRFARLAKRCLGASGLWPVFIWLSTRGKMVKWSEGDGFYYSYSAFDNAGQLAAKFPRRFFANTTPLAGTDLKHGAGHVAIIAVRA
ncbi:MAG: class I SAM-dependent methyltransferase [Novosphingobium sp.]